MTKIPTSPPNNYRPGDRVRVSPIGDPPFFGTVEAVGKLTVSVREDPAIRSVVWSRSIVEPAPADATESVLVTRDTLQEILDDANMALNDARRHDDLTAAYDGLWNIVYNVRQLMGPSR